jgi:hypothetical protein
MQGTSESSLWSAVVLHTIADAERAIEYLKKHPESMLDEQKLDKIYYEIHTKWFKQICEWANIHPEKITRHIKKIEKTNLPDNWRDRVNRDIKFTFKQKIVQ